jgi:Tfp pilus assembly protein PilO
MVTALSRFDRREFFLILTIMVFTVTTLVFTYLVLPKIKIYLAVAKTESILNNVVDNDAQLNDQIQGLSRDIDLLQRQLHGDMASLPVKEIEAYVVGKLQQISWQNDIQLVGIEPSAGAMIETFHEILFRVTLAGDHLNTYRWLREVSSELGFVLVKNFAMQPMEDRAQNPQLSVQLTMATYRAMR